MEPAAPGDAAVELGPGDRDAVVLEDVRVAVAEPPEGADLEREITAIVKRIAANLLELPGCGPLSAAKIIGEVAGADRFKSKAAFARWNGTAPIPVWTGSERFRLSRSGNRQVNAALHRIAITQWRGVGPGRAFIEERMANGKTKTAAIRLLRRRLSDEVLRRLLIDEQRARSDAPGAAVEAIAA